MCNLILRLYTHIWVHTCKNTFTMPSPSPVIVLASLCLQHLQLLPTLLCDGGDSRDGLAAASWQSKNGLLVTLPPSQPVAGLCLHHLKLLQAVAQPWCLIVEMRLAAASWQSKNCLLRYSRSKLRILIKMCCVVVVLCWSGPFRSRPRSIPFHTRSRPGPPMYHPWPTGEHMAGSHIDCS